MLVTIHVCIGASDRGVDVMIDRVLGIICGTDTEAADVTDVVVPNNEDAVVVVDPVEEEVDEVDNDRGVVGLWFWCWGFGPGLW